MRALGQHLTKMLVPEYRPKKPPSRMVAIMVPASTRPELTADEQISLRHLRHYLGSYDKYLLAPPGIDYGLEDFKLIRPGGKFFGSAVAFNRLTFLPRFYKLFQDYRFVLMYQLDCLVFSDDLLSWCKADVDFIGAPWIPGPDAPWAKEPAVGNGGFALMKVESILKVLYNRYRQRPFSFWKDALSTAFPRQAERPEKRLTAEERSGWGGSIRKAWRRVQESEVNWMGTDLFWAYDAMQYLPEFRLPDWKTALRFAFETSPRQCFELNGRKLPFGCHAWPKYDRGFWEAYLLKS
jgi:hypothetical protein